ncbi:MAG: SH3 domain-containing protein [Butyrivibrio sp.]|nr:SH3 domain-containing protein [Butyrivibrio sp.]
MKKSIRKRLVSLGLSVIVSATLFVTAAATAFAYTETTGTVSTDNVKVRASASTTASQVSSLKNGDKVDIVDESTDASGYVWYKIRVNKSEFGYVRSDLINKAGGSSAAAPAATTTTTQAASLPETTVTATEEKTATITADSVNVRKGAGTGYDSVGKVTKGTTVTVTGEATGTDNKTWYQVKFGNDRTGFVRSDLLEIGAAAAAEPAGDGEPAENAEVTEAAPEEGSEGAEDASQQETSTATASEAGDGNYALVYTPDNEGNDSWYLYDNFEGYRVKVNELIDAAKSSDEVAKLKKTNNTYKTIMIVLAVLIGALVIGLIFMALKLRDSLYYEDEEEEEYDRYQQNPRRRARDDDEEDDRSRVRRTSEERTVRPTREEAQRPSRPVRRDEDSDERTVRPTRRPAERDEDRPVRRSQEERPSRPARRDDYDEERPARRPSSYRDQDQAPAPKEAPKRRARNFLGDEDDFEFEFLDLDDDK